MTPSLLLVEDEDALAVLLDYQLSKEGFRVDRVADGEAAIRRLDDVLPDLVILDWMLPKLSGLEVCEQLRANPRTAKLGVLMLTARSDDADKVRALDAGADDYLIKPFGIGELSARLRALLRRAKPQLIEIELAYRDLHLDRSQKRLVRDGRPVALAAIEMKLLETFMLQPERVLSREQLLDAVWGADADVEARNVDVRLGRLRRALRAGGGTDLIRTVRGRGYALDGR